jgi:hypothetical protein
MTMEDQSRQLPADPSFSDKGLRADVVAGCWSGENVVEDCHRR